MDFFLNMLLYLIILTSVMSGWQHNVGVRLVTSDLFGVLFIFCYFLFLMTKSSRFTLTRPIKIFLMFLAGSLFIKGLSYVGLVRFYTVNEMDLAPIFGQFLRGLIYQLYMLILFFCIAHFLCRKNHEDRRKVALAFAVAVLASCVYQFVSLFLMVNYGMAIDKIIWPAINYNHPGADAISIGIRAVGYSIDGARITMYRLGGFAMNSNSLGAQILCVIPFLLLNVIQKRNKIYILLSLITICSLILTMSRGALVGLAISFLCIILIERTKIIKRLNLSVLLIAFAAAAIVVSYWDHLLVFYKGAAFFRSAPRIDLLGLAWRTFLESPLIGIGYNTQSILARQGITGIPDLHSFWSATFVETGLAGAICYLVFASFIQYSCYKRSNIFAKSLFYSYLGVMIAAIASNNLATFPVQLFVFLFFCIAMLESKNREELSERIEYED